jgi:PTS system mannose-specific IIB component/fructoselysine and glucoselysine-specific PTS system IIB component
MTVSLLRIDERLIHGQVVVGWGTQLRPDRYVVVDDALAESEWEQDIYRLGLPEDATAEFLSVNEARARFSEFAGDRQPTVILTRSATAMRELGRDGLLAGRPVNVGGLHHGPGRTERLSYVHLGEEDAQALTELEEDGAEVTAQDLPNARAIPLSEMVG